MQTQHICSHQLRSKEYAHFFPDQVQNGKGPIPNVRGVSIDLKKKKFL